MLEDIHSPGWIKHYSSTNAHLLLLRLLGDLANDADESVDRSSVRPFGFFAQPPVGSLVYPVVLLCRSGKLYKFHRTFLI
jgi:hypothetical protein